MQAGAEAVAFISSGIPAVHVSAEHQCTVWCNQVAQAVAQLLVAAAQAAQAPAQQRPDRPERMAGNRDGSLVRLAACAWGRSSAQTAHACRPLRAPGVPASWPATEVPVPGTVQLHHESRCGICNIDSVHKRRNPVSLLQVAPPNSCCKE